MAQSIDDRWFLLGAGIFFCFASIAVRRAITDIVNLTEITPLGPAPSAGKIVVGESASSEDDTNGGTPTIRLSTLRSLLKSPHDSISNTARSIVVQRFCSDPTELRGLVTDYFSDDAAAQGHARKAAKYLYDATAQNTSWRDVAPKILVTRAARDMIEHLQDEYAITSEQEYWSSLRPTTCEWAGVRPSRRKQPALPIDAFGLVARQRPITQTTSARRRRHREAMVLHEGDGAVSEDDIFRPRRNLS